MANEEQLSILKQGVDVWNKWRDKNVSVEIDLRGADLKGSELTEVDLRGANLKKVDFRKSNLTYALLSEADLEKSNLSGATLSEANLGGAYLSKANLSKASLLWAKLSGAHLIGSNFSRAVLASTIFGNSDISKTLGLDHAVHIGPSHISTDVFASSEGKIPEIFLRGCGLSDWEIEEVKLYNPDLSNDDVNRILYRMYELRATQALQISPLFVSYSQTDGSFVDKLETQLNKKGIRFWRDIHDMKAGRMEKQIDRAIRQNPTVLLVLSEHSLSSDWVEHEVRSARELEKEMKRDVLCPVALDNSWKSSHWPKRLMEQIMEYNILDFSAWEDDVKFEGMFRRLIDGLELFYRG